MIKHIMILLIFTFVFMNISAAGEQSVNQIANDASNDPFSGGFGEIAPHTQQDFTPNIDTQYQRVPLSVRTVTLKFLKAVNLKAALDAMSSEYGSISIDESTNTIIVCDTKENVNLILTEIKNADKMPSQVIIEVVIIDVELGDDTEIGVDWDILSTDNKDFSYRQSMIFPNRFGIVPPDEDHLDNMTAYQNIGIGGEIAIVTDDIRNVLNVLQEKRDIDILASPRVMVVSGQKASIKTIEQIPYQEVTQSSGGGGGNYAITSTQFKDVGVTMEVKATVTDEEKILLVISPSQSVTTGLSVGGVPIIDKREATTTLLMDDGQVAVMGGLRRQETQIIKRQIPLLGDLPLIGFIFSDNHKITRNSELIVLLSPHIHNNEKIPAKAMERFNEIRNKPILSLPVDHNCPWPYNK